jgi:Na+/H+ antiporter NhaD/arsenite permease-like protein
MNKDLSDFLKALTLYILINVTFYGLIDYKLYKLKKKHEAIIQRADRLDKEASAKRSSNSSSD